MYTHHLLWIDYLKKKHLIYILVVVHILLVADICDYKAGKVSYKKIMENKPETLMEDPSDTIERVLKLVHDVDTSSTIGQLLTENEAKKQKKILSKNKNKSKKKHTTKRRSKLVKGNILTGGQSNYTSSTRTSSPPPTSPPPPPPQESDNDLGKKKQQKTNQKRRQSTFHHHTKSSQLKYSYKLQEQYSRIKNAKEYNTFIQQYNANSMNNHIDKKKLFKKHITRHDYMNSIMEAEKNVKILVETKLHLVSNTICISVIKTLTLQCQSISLCC